jgi:GNAT superfamily N-acetyltransferase
MSSNIIFEKTKEKEKTVLYSKDKEKYVGFIIYNDCYIYRMYVLEEYRRKGIGCKLFEKSTKEMFNSCDEINWVGTFESSNFYNKFKPEVVHMDSENNNIFMKLKKNTQFVPLFDQYKAFYEK